jgi:hypothetical protein
VTPAPQASGGSTGHAQAGQKLGPRGRGEAARALGVREPGGGIEAALRLRDQQVEHRRDPGLRPLEHDRLLAAAHAEAGRPAAVLDLEELHGSGTDSRGQGGARATPARLAGARRLG